MRCRALQVRFLDGDRHDIQFLLVGGILEKQRGGSGELIRRVEKLQYNPRSSYLVDQSGYGAVVPHDIRHVLKLLCEKVRRKRSSVV